MSDTFIKIISENPESTALIDRFDEIADLLKSRLNVTNVDVEASELIRFVDCGGNLEEIICPKCGETVDFEWWGEAVENCLRSEFIDLTAEMPCCGKVCSLNDLRYNMPCGFAAAAIVIDNCGGDIDEAVFGEIGKLAGEKLRIIRGHY